MILSELNYEDQKKVAESLASLVLHGGATVQAAGQQFELSEGSAHYLMRKFGFTGVREARATHQHESVPMFLRRGDERSFDDIIQARRLGTPWRKVAEEFGYSNVDSFKRSIRYHCRKRGVEWPIETA